MRTLLIAMVGLVVVPEMAGAVSIDWVTVGAPGNEADDGLYGAVAEEYRISTFEITNGQYAEFLNAVAATGSNDLYSAEMASSESGGITRSGSAGSFSYQVKSGFAQKPANFVSFFDALRFANWLHNQQPTGAQDDATTEDGAYTITPEGIANNSITRNPGATIFLTSEDEWYKAAYYGWASSFYFTYPTTVIAAMSCAPPGVSSYTANCDNEVGGPTDVGAYTSSPGPWGTYDQGGNIYEWTEGLAGSERRSLRGGSFYWSQITLRSSIPGDASPEHENVDIGFRVASIPAPEPTQILLHACALATLALLRRRSPK